MRGRVVQEQYERAGGMREAIDCRATRSCSTGGANRLAKLPCAGFLPSRPALVCAADTLLAFSSLPSVDAHVNLGNQGRQPSSTWQSQLGCS